MNQNNNTNTNKWTNTKCHKCGKTNIGWQTNCLFCGFDLNGSSFQEEIMPKCPSCNAKVKKGQKFCTSCGNKIPENMNTSNISSKHNVCSKCGISLKPNAKFCTQCGSKV